MATGLGQWPGRLVLTYEGSMLTMKLGPGRRKNGIEQCGRCVRLFGGPMMWRAADGQMRPARCRSTLLTPMMTALLLVANGIYLFWCESILSLVVSVLISSATKPTLLRVLVCMPGILGVATGGQRTGCRTEPFRLIPLLKQPLGRRTRRVSVCSMW